MDTKYKTEEEYLTQLKGLVDRAYTQFVWWSSTLLWTLVTAKTDMPKMAELKGCKDLVDHWHDRYQKLMQAYVEIRANLYHQN